MCFLHFRYCLIQIYYLCVRFNLQLGSFKDLLRVYKGSCMHVAHESSSISFFSDNLMETVERLVKVFWLIQESGLYIHSPSCSIRIPRALSGTESPTLSIITTFQVPCWRCVGPCCLESHTELWNATFWWAHTYDNSQGPDWFCILLIDPPFSRRCINAFI